MCNFPSCLLKTASRIFGPMGSQWKGASYTSLTVAYVLLSRANQPSPVTESLILMSHPSTSTPSIITEYITGTTHCVFIRMPAPGPFASGGKITLPIYLYYGFCSNPQLLDTWSAGLVLARGLITRHRGHTLARATVITRSQSKKK